jgi:ribokinase
MRRKQIVVVGSVNLDMVATAEQIPGPGETLMGRNFQVFHGGKGANQAVAIAKLGYPVCMVAKVGDDEFGERLRRGLRETGVDIRWVTTAKHSSSGVALVSIDVTGENSIIVVPGANGKLLPRDMENAKPALRSAGMILTQLETPLETLEYLASGASRHQVPLMLDPAPARELPSLLLRRVTFLTPNETETCVLCGIDARQLNCSAVTEYAQKLRECGPANVIIKLGGHGACLAGKDGRTVFLPAFKVRAVDTTAAGDAFNGGLAVALMQGQDLEEAARFASAVAAVSVTRAGAQPSMPTARQVRRFLKEAAVSATGEQVGSPSGVPRDRSPRASL